MRRSSSQAQQEVERVKAVSYGVFEVLKRYPRGVFTAMGLRFAENIMYYLVVTFSIVYLKDQVGADTGDILWWLLAAHAVHFLVIPQVGRLSDRFGRRPVYIVGAVLAGTWGFFAFPMMNTANYLAIMAAVIIGLVIHAIMYAPQPAIMAEMFPTRMRYSGVSLGYQVTSIVAGSLAPIIAVKLLGSLRLLGADRAVPGRGRRGHPGRGAVHARDERHRPGDRSMRPTARNSRRRASYDRTRRAHRAGHRRRERYRRGLRTRARRARRGGHRRRPRRRRRQGAWRSEIGGKAWAVDLSDVAALEESAAGRRHPGQQRGRAARQPDRTNFRPTASGS